MTTPTPGARLPRDGDARLVLVSGSPRRRALIARLGVSVIIAPVTIDERIHGGSSPSEQTIRVARAKLDAYLERRLDAADRAPASEWALAADTLVFLGKRALGKPGSEEEARGMLRALSGRAHRVVTGLALANPRTRAVAQASSATEVRFAPLDDAEIEWYLSTGEWRDAAGAYRIQERGEVLVEEIRGSYSNVVGLPLGPLYRFLLAQGFPFGDSRALLR